MKNLVIGVLFLLGSLTAFANPVVVREASGLRLIAYRRFVLMPPWGTDDEIKLRMAYHRFIIVYVMNCGNVPMTVPTVPYNGQGETLDGTERITFYDFDLQKGDEEEDIIVSPVKYEPVTLAPGEMAQLERRDSASRPKGPIAAKANAHDVWQMLTEDMKKDAQISDYVSIHVSKSLATRNGWWAGDLLVRVEERGRAPNANLPNQSPQTPVSRTPAAGAPVAPPPGIAGR